MNPNQKTQINDIDRWFAEKLAVLLRDVHMRYELIDGIDSDDAMAQAILTMVTITAGLVATRTRADSIEIGRRFAKLVYKIRISEEADEDES